MSGRPDKFVCRTQVIGTLYFLCPKCGKQSTYRIKQGDWRFVCIQKGCGFVFAYGGRVLDLDNPRGAKRIVPPDVFMPPKGAADGLLEGLPIAERAAYKNGDPLIKVEDAPDAERSGYETEDYVLIMV